MGREGPKPLWTWAPEDDGADCDLYANDGGNRPWFWYQYEKQQWLVSPPRSGEWLPLAEWLTRRHP